MLEVMFYFAGLCGAIWLGIALVDMLVAVVRREWRFSIRSMLVFTAVIALVCGVIATIFRK